MRSRLFILWLMASAALADESYHRILGLSAPEREPDLRATLKAIPEVELVHIDHEKTVVTLRYDPSALFLNENPKKPLKREDIDKRLDAKLRSASRGSFSLRPLCSIPQEELERLSIRILIPDCKGCRLGTYNSIARLDGVEWVRFGDDFSELIAWIDPKRTNRATLIEKMKKDRIEFPNP